VHGQHPFWCTGSTCWDLHSESPDLFLHLSKSDLLLFKGDLGHRKLNFHCRVNSRHAVPAGRDRSNDNRRRRSEDLFVENNQDDVVVGLGTDGMVEKLDKEEAGWKMSGKYVSLFVSFQVSDEDEIVH
jgi:damage-control phosphatase, subfamily III